MTNKQKEEYTKQCLACEELQSIKKDWIPSQEELQSLIRTKVWQYNPTVDLKLDLYMRECVSGLICYSGFQMLCFEQMWLMFLMAKAYNKQWNNDTQQWEFRQ